MSVHEDTWKIPFIDVMMGLTMVFLVLLSITISATVIQTIQAKNELKTHELYSIRLEWPGDKHDDVDLYLQDPTGAICYFKKMSANLMVLNHDDTGSDSNVIKMSDGSVISSAFNEESITIRGIIPGEYICNVHMYRKADDSPTSVNVYLYKNTENGSILVTSKTIIMNNRGDESTAFRFTLTKSGECGDINQMPIKFVDKASSNSTPIP